MQLQSAGQRRLSQRFPLLLPLHRHAIQLLQRQPVWLFALQYRRHQVGNRLTRVKDSVTTSYGYDNNDKLTTVNSVTSASYDGNGNLTSTYGNFPATTLAYNDANQLTSVAYPGGRVRSCRTRWASGCERG